MSSDHAAGLGVSLNNAILSHAMDLSGIAVLPTQPLYEVEIGIAAPRKADRSPAAENFMDYVPKTCRTEAKNLLCPCMLTIAGLLR